VPRVQRVTDLPDVGGAVAAWGLAGTRPVVVLAGGAAGMEAGDRDPAARAISEAVVPAVVAAGAALLTGGTDAGVMRLAGEARRAADAHFPLVGVAPADLVALPDAGPSGAGPTGVSSPSAGAGLAADAPASRPRAALQLDHTHLLAVPGARWGEETAWLFTAAEAIAGGRPVVTVCVNGGAAARGEVVESVRRGHRALLAEGTGRAADEMAAALGGLPAPAPGGSPGPHAASDQALAASGLVHAVPLGENGALRRALEEALGDEHRGSAMSQATAGARWSGSQASYEDEMRVLIERADATEEQRLFLRSRWLDQVVYMGDRATESKRRYYRFRLATVIGGVIVPALVSISLMGPDKLGNVDGVIRLATFLVSLLVAITASVEGFYHFGDRWRHYRVNAELLKAEGWQYLTRSGAYHKAPDADAAFQAFSGRVEEILQDDVEGFMSKVASTSPIERHDIFTKF
jgi:hypothetical protein